MSTPVFPPPVVFGPLYEGLFYSGGNMDSAPQLLIMYNHCFITWFDLYDCACDSKCPECGEDIEAMAWAEAIDVWEAARLHWEFQETI